MVAKVFLLLLIVHASICRGQMWLGVTPCKAQGGICVPMEKCKTSRSNTRQSCRGESEAPAGAMCCHPDDVIDSRRLGDDCLGTCATQFENCSRDCDIRPYTQRQISCKYWDIECRYIRSKFWNFNH